MTNFPISELILEQGPLRFTALTCGWTENTGANVVMCLHGFPDNAETFRHQMPALAAAGYRVICPTLRGYEPSSIPADRNFGLIAIAQDVIAWVDQCQVDQLHLVGHDWGASITYLAGVLAPNKFTTLTTMAVPHSVRFAEGLKAVPRQKRLSWYMMFFQLHGLADWAVERKDWALIKKLWRDWSPSYQLSEAEWDSLRSTFESPGVKESMLAYYRQNLSLMTLLGLRQADTAGLTRINCPTLAITGAEDGCIATELYDHVMHDSDFPAGLQIERIQGAGHFAHLEAPETVNALLLNWFQR